MALLNYAQRNRFGVYEYTGVPKHVVLAYKWFCIAAAKGNKISIAAKAEVEKSMTPEQIAEGEHLAKEWAKQHRVE